jgi:nitronate monooxygenase
VARPYREGALTPADYRRAVRALPADRPRYFLLTTNGHLAARADADIVVAQGTEAGGHGALRATLRLAPAVADAVAPIPVLAAGGVADGRGLAAAQDTLRTRVFDIVRGYARPAPFTGRTLRNRFTARWGGHEVELADAVDAE